MFGVHWELSIQFYNQCITEIARITLFAMQHSALFDERSNGKFACLWNETWMGLGRVGKVG
jgi:hypothetical protein